MSNLNRFFYTTQMLVGFSDGDGGWSVKITKRKDQVIGFAPSFSFTQAIVNMDVLEAAQALLGGNRKIRTPGNSGIFTVSLNTEIGVNFLKILASYPPIITTHYEAYLISLEVLAFVKKRPQQIEGQLYLPLLIT
uniref:Homing endonuclease LAGLIDADG domain-containing protein n=1 Tax=Chlorococcum echinozygotum TaxID=48000 RepID=Q8WKZ2_CHLEC|nr:putative protein [Chlorococcum echinozygotum]